MDKAIDLLMYYNFNRLHLALNYMSSCNLEHGKLPNNVKSWYSDYAIDHLKSGQYHKYLN